MDHPYCYPGSNVYRNKENIRDKMELDATERVMSFNRLVCLPRTFAISPNGYRLIHQFIFQDLYDWAGQDRWIDTGRTGPFCKAEFIAGEMDKRFAAIDAEHNLRGLSAKQFAERAGEHVGELNAIHPFLDGNGRCLRAFLKILAEQAGHQIDLARIDPRAWNEASIASFHRQDYLLLRDVIFSLLVEPGRRS